MHPLRFDRSFLPKARFEFAVVSDTHHILDPEPYAVEFASVRSWPKRATWAAKVAAAVGGDFLVHLGDLTEENASKADQLVSREKACLAYEETGLKPCQVAGNVDIGDKPDPTMFADWVTSETLTTYESRFGRSYYSFDHENVHIVVLNSQIMGSALPQAREQKDWVEDDLAKNRKERIFVFLHMPPFFVAETEPALGFYNSLNEPARGWLTGLCRRYAVELLMCGHTHFRMFNRVGGTRLFVAPSPTTSRAGFYEAFSVAPPPEQGRNDPAKLGMLLVRVLENGTRVHFIPTGGQTETDTSEIGWSRLLTRTSHDLSSSPLGLFLRTPLAVESEGALAWPSALRQGVRDDHPFLACLEVGARHIRVPISDLQTPLQQERLSYLRDEGVELTAFCLWSEHLELDAAKLAGVDWIELQIPGCVWPKEGHLNFLQQSSCPSLQGVVLAPLLTREVTSKKYHPRMRVGYRPEELSRLDSYLESFSVTVDRVVCHLDDDVDPLAQVQEFGHKSSLQRVAALDFVLRLSGVDERKQVQRLSRALCGVAALPGSRLFVDTLVDLDRTNDVQLGLLDRLSNPRLTFQAARCLNTILFSEPRSYDVVPHADKLAVQLAWESGCYWLIPSWNSLPMNWFQFFDGEISVFDLIRGWRRNVNPRQENPLSWQSPPSGPALVEAPKQ